MVSTFETNKNIKGSRWRFVEEETYTDSNGDITYFYAPRQIETKDYEDNIKLVYSGKYTLPILAYRMYKSVLGKDAVRLWWLILEYSSLKSINDVEVGTMLTMPSPNRVKEIIK